MIDQSTVNLPLADVHSIVCHAIRLNTAVQGRMKTDCSGFVKNHHSSYDQAAQTLRPFVRTSMQPTDMVVPFHSTICDRRQTFQMMEISDKIVVNILKAKKLPEHPENLVPRTVAWMDRGEFSHTPSATLTG